VLFDLNKKELDKILEAHHTRLEELKEKEEE